MWLWMSGAAGADADLAAATLARLEASATQGVVEAQVELAMRLLEGRGIARDIFQAMEWFFKAAERGSCEAQYRLGMIYAYGQGVLRNEHRALRWLRRAMRGGHPGAHRELARLWQRMALQRRGLPFPETRRIAPPRELFLPFVFSTYNRRRMLVLCRGGQEALGPKDTDTLTEF